MLELIKIEPGCPYYGWATSIDLTCEEGLCGWIRQPSNTFSSFIFFVIAFFILRRGLKTRFTPSIAIGTVTVFIGFASTLAHATHLKVFGFTDFTFQYLLIFVLIWLNFRRLNGPSELSILPFVPAAWLVSGIIQWNFPQTSLLLYGAFFLALLYTEWRVYRIQPQTSYKNYFLCALILGLGAIAFFLDFSRIVCDPNDHFFQMHAVWHILAGVSLIFLDRHYQAAPRH